MRAKLGEVRERTTHSIFIKIEDGPLIPPERPKGMTRQITLFEVRRQDDEKWFAKLSYRALKKNGEFAATGSGFFARWDKKVWTQAAVQELVAACLSELGIDPKDVKLTPRM